MKDIKGLALFVRIQGTSLARVGWGACTVLLTFRFKEIITGLSATILIVALAVNSWMSCLSPSPSLS